MAVRGNPLFKIIDRYIGIPIVFVLGAFHLRRRKPVFGKSPRFVLLKTNAIGDTVLLEAIIQEIKASYRTSHITVICGFNNMELVKLIPNIDEIVCFAFSAPVKSLLAVRNLLSFDCLIDFGPWMRINAIISGFVHADFKIGFQRSRMYRHYVYDLAVIHQDDVHEIENYRNLLRAGSIFIHGYLPTFRTISQPLKNQYVILHPFPGGSMQLQRKWDSRKWCALAESIYKEYKYAVLISGGKNDFSEAHDMYVQLKKAGVQVELLAGRVTLKEMVVWLSNAEMVISVNTGIMHLAAAVGSKLVALHGATNPIRWGPLSDKAVIVQTGECCQPCISLGFESKCQQPRCMENMTVDMVWEAVRQCEKF